MFALIKALLQGSIEHTPRYYYGVLSLHNQNRKKNYQRKQDYPHECRTTLILHSAPPRHLGSMDLFLSTRYLGTRAKRVKTSEMPFNGFPSPFKSSPATFNLFFVIKRLSVTFYRHRIAL